MKRLIISICALFGILYFIPNRCIANVRLSKDLDIIEKNDKITVSIIIEDSEVSAMDLSIYYDMDKLEYIGGEENSNQLKNEIKYTWYDETGGLDKSSTKKVANFMFKALKEGSTDIGIKGLAYNINGEEISQNWEGVKIEIGNIREEVVDIVENEEEGSGDENSSKLKSLRISEEGISPNFSKDIYEYYFVTDQDIKELKVMAVPENVKSTVNIVGNTDLRQGENTILIEVISENMQNKSKYYIHATKAEDLASVNANLETLAIENEMLYPAFETQITDYKVEVDYEKTDLRILAIPQQIGAKVEIIKQDELKVGKNDVLIKVTAKNGSTVKKYKINVYRRNQDEQKEYEKGIEENKSILENIIAEKMSVSEEAREVKQEEIDKKRDKNFAWVFLIIIFIIVLVVPIIAKNKHM